MKILITGAAGFIGLFLCKRLLETANDEIIGLDNQPENLLDFATVLSEELIRVNILPKDFDIKKHMKLVAMQKSDVPVTYAEINDLERDFGYKSSTSLREGLRCFSEWYIEYYGR